MTENLAPFKFIELYSGIGGFHYAVAVSQVHGQVVGAVDINTNANTVYRHNFPDTELLQWNIQGLTTKDLDDLNIDLMWMSPPCQPFTRVGLKKDTEDNRTASFLHVIDLISKLQVKPRWIMLENVKGFEVSEAKTSLIEVLVKAGYQYQEFLLSPLQFGIPNSRLRYYVVAWLKQAGENGESTNNLMESFPCCRNHCCCLCHQLNKDTSCTHSEYNCVFCRMDSTFSTVPAKQENEADYQQTEALNKGDISIICMNRIEHSTCVISLENFIENPEIETCMLSDDILMKFAIPLDIVNRAATRTCCFTKAYGHYVKGTGSVFTPSSPEMVAEVYKQVATLVDDDTQKLTLLKSLNMRYFTPTEVSKLMGFPENFKFPGEISRRQQYKLLGNSLNVHVVAALLKWTMSTHKPFTT